MTRIETALLGLLGLAAYAIVAAELLKRRIVAETDGEDSDGAD